MFVFDAISAIEFGDGELRIDFVDGAVDKYRVRDGQLEFFTRRSHNPAMVPSVFRRAHRLAHPRRELALRQIEAEGSQ